MMAMARAVVRATVLTMLSDSPRGIGSLELLRACPAQSAGEKGAQGFVLEIRFHELEAGAIHACASKQVSYVLEAIGRVYLTFFMGCLVSTSPRLGRLLSDKNQPASWVRSQEILRGKQGVLVRYCTPVSKIVNDARKITIIIPQGQTDPHSNDQDGLTVPAKASQGLNALASRGMVLYLWICVHSEDALHGAGMRLTRDFPLTRVKLFCLELAVSPHPSSSFKQGDHRQGRGSRLRKTYSESQVRRNSARDRPGTFRPC